MQDLVNSLRQNVLKRGSHAAGGHRHRGTVELAGKAGAAPQSPAGAPVRHLAKFRKEQSNAQKVKAAIQVRLELRQTHAKKAAKAYRSRKKVLDALPSQELNALRDAFDVYADDRGNLPAEDLVRCLAELGLGGRTRHERWAVERLCTELYERLRKEKEVEPVNPDTLAAALGWRAGPRRSGAQEGEAGAGEEEPLSAKAFASECSAHSGGFQSQAQDDEPAAPALRDAKKTARRLQRMMTRRRSNNTAASVPAIAKALSVVEREQARRRSEGSLFNGVDGSLCRAPLEISLSFEEFNADVVPQLREQLHSIRHEEHFEYFLRMLDKKDAVALRPAEVLELVAAMHLDVGIAEAALRELREPGQEEAEDGHTKRQAQVLDAGLTLEVDVLHEVLMQVEELTERKRNARAQEIRRKMDLDEEVFWACRHELDRLYHNFQRYDDDEDQNLTHSEAKLLLKHLGFQPYRLGPEAAFVQAMLTESDEDGNGLVDFLEFLGLMARIRGAQLETRRARLAEQWARKPSQETGGPDEERTVDVSLKEVVEMLAAAGLAVTQTLYHQQLVRCIAEDLFADLLLLSFRQLEDIAQRVAERLQSEATEGILEMVDQLGLSMAVFGEFQRAFDQCQLEDGLVPPQQLRRALRERIGREPTSDELEDLYAEVKRDRNQGVDIEGFFRILHSAASPKHMFTKEKMFTLNEVPQRKLREILRAFRVAEDFILKCSCDELLEHVANYLEVKPTSDLREELSERVTTVRQLVAYAVKKGGAGEAAAEAARPR